MICVLSGSGCFFKDNSTQGRDREKALATSPELVMVTEIAYTYLPSDARAVRARRGDDVRYGLGVTKRPCGASLGLVGTCISVLIKRLVPLIISPSSTVVRAPRAVWRRETLFNGKRLVKNAERN